MRLKGTKAILLCLACGGAFLSGEPALGQTANQDNKDESAPLKVTIRPSYKRFDGVFSESGTIGTPRVDNAAPCPEGAFLTCDQNAFFSKHEDRIAAIVAGYAFERRLKWYEKPDLGFLMGKAYVGLRDYEILASFGVDPNLKPLWPWPQSTGVYGTLWDADTPNVGDLMIGPIMLARRGPSQIEILGKNRKHFSGD